MPHTFVLCTNDSFTLFFLTLRLDPPKGRSLFLFSANPSSPTKKCGTVHLDLMFLKEVCHWVIPACLSELMPIA